MRTTVNSSLPVRYSAIFWRLNVRNPAKTLQAGGDTLNRCRQQYCGAFSPVILSTPAETPCIPFEPRM